MSASLLDKILQPGGLSVVFQPIFEVHAEGRRLHALECLVRGPSGTNIESPDILFEYARRKREASLVDKTSIITVLREASKLCGEPRLSINVHASTLGRDRTFPSFLKETAEACSISLSRLTVEIVEQAPFWDKRTFLSTLDDLRSFDVQIAVDDVGYGQSNYQMILDCRPDYLKIDRYLVSGSHADSYRRAILESIALVAQKFGSGIVAEGVECIPDLDTVLSLGINLIQGFIFCRPLPRSELIASDLLHYDSAPRVLAICGL